MGYTLNDMKDLAEELKKRGENIKKRLEELGLLTKKVEEINEGLNGVKEKQESAIQKMKNLNEKTSIKKIEVKQTITFKSILEFRKEIKFYGGIK